MRDPLAVGKLSRRSLIWDLIVAVLFGALAIPIQAEQTTPTTFTACLITLALAVRRLAPSVMIVLALASATLQVVSIDIAIFSSLAYAVLYYTTGSHPNRKVRFGSLGVGIVGSFIAGYVIHRFYQTFESPTASSAIVFEIAMGTAAAMVVVIGGWTVGFIRHQRRSVEEARVAGTIAELQRQRMLDLYDEQAERTRLARNMHDVVAHSLAVVVAQAEGARYTLDANPQAAKDALAVIADTAREALGDVRGLLEQLRDEDAGATPTPHDRERLFARMQTAGMNLHTTEFGDSQECDEAIIRAAHRVLIEALTNALKYGDLDQPVTVAHHWQDGLRLEVTNALSAAPLDPGGAGHGIRGMSERAVALGGTLTSTPTQGSWRVELIIPAAGTAAVAQSQPQERLTP